MVTTCTVTSVSSCLTFNLRTGHSSTAIASRAYGCAGYPDGTYRGNRAQRYNLLGVNALDRVNEAFLLPQVTW